MPARGRNIDGVLALEVQREVADVAHHTDNRGPRTAILPLAATQTDEVADGSLTGQLPLRKGLVDHHRARRLRQHILRVEQAAGDQRNAHGFEISWSDVVLEKRLAVGVFPLEIHGVYVAVAAQGQLARESGGDHAGHLPHALQGLVQEAQSIRISAVSLPGLLPLYRHPRHGAEPLSTPDTPPK